MPYKDNDHRIAFNKRYYENHKDVIKASSAAYYEQNGETRRAYQRDYGKTHREELRPYHREYKRNRRASDSLFNLSRNMGRRIRAAFVNKGFKKTSRTAEIIGCDFEHLQAHLILTAVDNYGYWCERADYHIDHIIPLASAVTEADLVRLSHYTNLQFLYPEHNLTKADNMNWVLPTEKVI